MIYLAIDGDDVGKIIERLFMENKEEELKLISHYIINVVAEISKFLKKENFEIIFSTGDNILAKGEDIDIKELYAFLTSFKHICTFSVGISSTLEKTYLALKYAKAIGKSAIVKYGSSLEILKI